MGLLSYLQYTIRQNPILGVKAAVLPRKEALNPKPFCLSFRENTPILKEEQSWAPARVWVQRAGPSQGRDSEF